MASYYYLQTSRLMLQAVEQGAPQEGLGDRAHQYAERGALLAAREVPRGGEPAAKPGIGAGELQRARRLLEEALELDETGRGEEALEQYLEAVELCLATKERVEDAATRERLSTVAGQALERAEALKGRGQEVGSSPTPAPKPQVTSLLRPLGNLNWGEEGGGGGASGSGGGGYTAEEKKVLADTSLINGRQYLPFIAADLGERFAFPLPWSDPGGILALRSGLDLSSIMVLPLGEQ